MYAIRSYYAYAVHSDVGHRCVAARVDHRMVPLRTRLNTGAPLKSYNFV